MTWYAATLLFRSSVGTKQAARPLCEQRVVLFQRASESAARTAANTYARAEEHEYDNVHGERVKWRFDRLEKLEEVNSPTRRGWEVASRFVRRASARE